MNSCIHLSVAVVLRQLLFNNVTCSKSHLDLSCLQHPEMWLLGIPPDLRHITNTNLDPCSIMEGILLD